MHVVVSTNGGTPIAGWFIVEKTIPLENNGNYDKNTIEMDDEQGYLQEWKHPCGGNQVAYPGI